MFISASPSEGPLASPFLDPDHMSAALNGAEDGVATHAG